MNASLKTFAIAAFFSLSTFAANAVTPATSNDSLKVKSEEKTELDVFDNIFEESNTLVVRFYNAADEEVFMKEITAEELLVNKEIQTMLQKSDFMLSMGNEYLYLLKD